MSTPDLLAQRIVDEGLPAPVLEHRFHPTRKWRFDLAWPDRMVALEYEGGQYTEGRHYRSQGFADDCEKYNEAALMGWLVLRATRSMVDDGSWLDFVRRALTVVAVPLGLIPPAPYCEVSGAKLDP